MERAPLPERMFYRIGEVAEHLGVRSSVLRYWETEFRILAPHKSASGQRVYRKQDVELLCLLKKLLYIERYSIEGARMRLKDLKKEGILKATAQSAYHDPAAINVTPEIGPELANAELSEFSGETSIDQAVAAAQFASQTRVKLEALKAWVALQRTALTQVEPIAKEFSESLKPDFVKSGAPTQPTVQDW